MYNLVTITNMLKDCSNIEMESLYDEHINVSYEEETNI